MEFFKYWGACILIGLCFLFFGLIGYAVLALLWWLSPVFVFIVIGVIVASFFFALYVYRDDKKKGRGWEDLGV